MTISKTAHLWQNWSRLEKQILTASGQQDYYRLISDYTCVSCRLAEQLQQQQNPLLQQWCLRRCLFTLADTGSPATTDQLLRQLCLDQLYIPLLALQRLYRLLPDGSRQINQLNLQLQRLFRQQAIREHK